MNRRNFLQLLGAAALCGALGIKPLTDDELRRQLDAEFQRNLDELARRYNEYLAHQQEITDRAIAEHNRWWTVNG